MKKISIYELKAKKYKADMEADVIRALALKLSNASTDQIQAIFALM